MRFTALFAVMAASAAAAQEYEVPGEETTTLTATTTHTITITECAPDYADCPLNKPTTTTTVVEVPPTTSEVIIPTSEPVYETPIIETPSLSPVPPPVEPPVETSSSIPHYPVSNSTTHAGPTAPHTTTLLPVPSTVSGNLPIVTETQAVPVPTTPGAAETSEIPQAAAAGVFVQGGLLASMVALGLFGLF